MTITAPTPTATEATTVTRRSSRGKRIWQVVDTVVWALVIVTAIVVAIAVQFGGLQVTRVLSPSMVPTFSPGDLVVIRSVDAMDLQVGDIPMLPDPDEPSFQYVHRVITISKTPERGEVSVVTKGDANADSDTPVTVVTPKVPVVMFSVPLGRFNLANVTWNWSLWLLGGAVIVFLGLLVLPSRKPEAPADEDGADTP